MLACTVHKIWHASDFILIFSKGHNSRKGENSDKKKCVSYFSMRNPYMKFQNPSMPGSWWMDARTDGFTDNPKPICPVNFFEVGSIITIVTLHTYIHNVIDIWSLLAWNIRGLQTKINKLMVPFSFVNFIHNPSLKFQTKGGLISCCITCRHVIQWHV